MANAANQISPLWCVPGRQRVVISDQFIDAVLTEGFRRVCRRRLRRKGQAELSKFSGSTRKAIGYRPRIRRSRFFIRRRCLVSKGTDLRRSTEMITQMKLKQRHWL